MDDTTQVNMPAGESDDIAAARAEIEHTREEMTETIEAIEERLSPAHLQEQAMQAVTAELRAVEAQAESFLRRYAVPLIVAGVVIAAGTATAIILLRRQEPEPPPPPTWQERAILTVRQWGEQINSKVS